MKIQLDMYQTLAVAVLVLLLGNFLKKRINFLEKFCIPSPVIGGLLFAIMTCICYTTGIAEFSFDDTLREVCMVFFFTSVGFQANLKILKSGGKSLIVFLGLVIVLILLQNVTAVGLAKALGLEFDEQEIIERVRNTSISSPEGKTSIYADLKAGRRTEVNTISGAVVRAGEKTGVDVPTHRMIVNMVHAMEDRDRKETK